MISGNMVGAYSQLGKTFIITDSYGNELTGVCVDNPVVFTAHDNDVREGMTYASDEGVSIGTKNIPIYRTRAGSQIIGPNGSFTIPMAEFNGYDYTVFQCMISVANMENLDNSVSTNMIAMNNGIYEVNSTIKVADVFKNESTRSIDLNINNNSDDYYFIHYFTYREEE